MVVNDYSDELHDAHAFFKQVAQTHCIADTGRTRTWWICVKRVVVSCGQEGCSSACRVSNCEMPTHAFYEIGAFLCV